MSDDKLEKGMLIRRQVLGDEHVDKAINSATEFTRPLQEMLAANCWGDVWASELIPRKFRSLITIAILSALKAPTELKAHVRGALRNGCSAEEIQDVLLHTTVYCGVPAGVDAFRAANDVIQSAEG